MLESTPKSNVPSLFFERGVSGWMQGPDRPPTADVLLYFEDVARREETPQTPERTAKNRNRRYQALNKALPISDALPGEQEELLANRWSIRSIKCLSWRTDRAFEVSNGAFQVSNAFPGE